MTTLQRHSDAKTVQVKKAKAKSIAIAGNKKQKKQKMEQDASWDNRNGELYWSDNCDNLDLMSEVVAIGSLN
jgi:hypothetical protein